MNNNLQLKDVVLAVTYRCNLRCQMCHIWQRTDLANLPIKTYQNLPATLKYINISGGEPFLHPEILLLTKTIHQACPQATITFSSNGYATELIYNQVKEILLQAPNIAVAISLDGLEQTHDKVRGIKGSFNNALKTIKLLKELGFNQYNLKIAFTINDDNIEQLPDVYNLAEELSVDFTLAVVHNSENYFTTQDNQLTNHRQIKKVLQWLIKQELKKWQPKKWLRAYFAYGLWHFIKHQKRLLPDYSGRSSAFIDPRGNIFSSDVGNKILGNLENFDEIKLARAKNNQPASWMICTARLAMKKHPFKILAWILINKFIKNVELN